MFGIGLPEMIVIFVVALIVVGPDKLPEMAKSLAKGIMEMKKAANQIKENLTDEEDTLNEVKKDLQETAADLKQRMLDAENSAIERQSTIESTSNQKQELIEHTQEDLRPWEVDAQQTPEKNVTDQPAEPAEETTKKQ